MESRIKECLLLPYVGPVAHPGKGPAGPASRLFLDQTEAQSAEKKFLRPGPPSIRVWMTPPPPPLSEGLNPPLGVIQFHVTLSIFFT